MILKSKQLDAGRKPKQGRIVIRRPIQAFNMRAYHLQAKSRDTALLIGTILATSQKSQTRKSLTSHNYPRRWRLKPIAISAVAPSKKSFMTTTRSLLPQARSAFSLTHGNVFASHIGFVANSMLFEALAANTLSTTALGIFEAVAWH